jgi:drug/metabolite transporter (DMT)-like permease
MTDIIIRIFQKIRTTNGSNNFTFLHKNQLINSISSKSKLRTLFALVICILLWASAFVGIRSALGEGYSPGSVALLRFLVASASLGIYAYFSGMRLPKKEDIFMIILTGFVGITVYHLALNFGEKTVKAGTASFIISSVPILTGIFSIFFFRQYLNIWGWIGIFIGFSGIAFISFSESNFDKMNWGTLLVFLAAVGGSLYVMFQKKLLKKYTALEVTAYSIWAGTFFMLIFLPNLIKDIHTARFSATMDIVYLGVFPGAIAYVLWNYALHKFTSPAHITTFLYFSPIVTMIIGVIWIGELPNLLTIIAGLVVLAGVILANTMGTSRTQNKIVESE